MIVVETDKDFEISFEYHPAKVDAVKRIPGAKFYGKNKTWHVPLYRHQEVQELIILWGAKSAHTHHHIPEQTGEIPPLPELTIDIPLARPMFPFQGQGVAYNLEKKRVIIGDDMGLGKSQQVIATTIAANAFPCLIICPATLKLNWQNEWKMVADRKAMVLNDRVKSSWEMYHKVGMIDVFIVNYESLPKFFVKEIVKEYDKAGNEKPLRLNQVVFRESINIFKTVVIDELHKCRNAGSRQSKLALGIAKDKEYVFGLTGTALVNKPKDIFAQLAIIGRLQEVVSHIPQPIDKFGKLIDFSGFKRFMDRYCDGGRGASHLKELQYRLKTICYYRRQKQEVLKDLPDKVRQIMIVEITTRKEYDKAENDFIGYLKTVKGCTDPEIRKKMKGEVMVKIGILKNISARGKIEAVQEYIEEMADAGEKVIMFCYLREIVKEIMDANPKSLGIHGEVSLEDRARNEKLFQTSSDYNLMVCNYKSAGLGLNLTASSKVGFIEFPWTAADCDQCEDRSLRIGQKNSVLCTYFLGEKTIDRWCYDIIQKKRAMGTAITGDQDYVEEEIIDDLINLFNQR